MLVSVLLVALSNDAAPDEASVPIALGCKPDRVIVTAGGAPFTEVRFGGDSKVFLDPVLAPGGSHATRRWPEETIADDVLVEEHDHPHHRGLWFAHGAVNGHDFWTGENGKSRIELADPGESHESKSDTAKSLDTFQVKLAWKHDDEVVLTEERSFHFAATTDTRTIDLEMKLIASEGDVTFGDTKEGTMAIRLAETLRLAGKSAKGAARNSEGVTGALIWGKRARFVDYSGPLAGRPDTERYGVVMFDHPANPRHPTWWHARDYGLFAANPFGMHDFEGKDAGAGDLKVPKGASVTFRYRVMIYRGARTPADLESLAPRS